MLWKIRGMAWRIDEAVTHGEIDNTVEGLTTGRVWLAGRDEPLVLSLVGDCWRDLAGTRLRFENPRPLAEADVRGLAVRQHGIVGDMTASRKTKAPPVDDGPPRDPDDDGRAGSFEWRNTLYLEWFSETNGRVVIETTDFLLEITAHEWRMDEDAEEAQKLANLQAMRDFMAQVIRRREPTGDSGGDAGGLDEFEWEERLKESDRLTDAYQEVLEKYMEDSDSERKEAFVMGWDGVLDALAERDESGDPDSDPDGFPPDFGSGDGFAPEGDGTGFFRAGREHPLQVLSQELALRAMDVVSAGDGAGTPSYQLVSNLLQVSGKLAASLNPRGSGHEPETGYVLAVLKRCVNWLNDAVACCQQLMAAEEDPDQLAALAHLRASAYEIRDGITELRRGLK
jgi:hypothetical protein